MSTEYDDSLWRAFYRKCMPHFEGTPMHEYYKKLAREEVCQEHLQTQRNILLAIVQARFPKLINSAKALAKQIKDVAVMIEVVGKVGAAQTTEEAMEALLSWLPDGDSDDSEV